MMEQFGSNTNPVALAQTAMACLLMPPPTGAELDTASRLADSALRLDPTAPSALLARGLADYRQGKFAETIAWERKALIHGASDVTARAVMAMAMCQSGQTNEARAVLSNSSQTNDFEMALDPSKLFSENWHDAICAQILRRQALNLLRNPAAPQNDDGRASVSYDAATGGGLTISYSAAGGPLSTNRSMQLHLGWNNGERIVHPDVEMVRKSETNRWFYTLAVPPDARQLDFNVHDGDGQEDRNGGVDWHFPLGTNVLALSP